MKNNINVFKLKINYLLNTLIANIKGFVIHDG